MILVLMLIAGGAAAWLTGEVPSLPGWEAAVRDGRARAADRAGPSRADARYVTAPVERGEIRRTITATGTLNAILNVEVGSQLSGQIAQLFVDFNDEVKRGQPLAELDQRSFLARRAEAEAAAEAAKVNVDIQKQRLERARIDARDAEAQRAVLQARIDNAKIRLDAAEKELERKEALRQRGASSTVELDDSRSRRDLAAAALREAQAIAAAQENAVEGTKVDLERARAELASAEASVPQKEAALHAAAIDVDRTTIRSPIDGVVVGRNVNEGQTLATTLEARTLFIIAGDLRRMEIHAKVDETDIGKIEVGQEAVFTVDAHPGRQFLATVRQIRKAPQVQQNVVTYTVVLATDNPDNLLLPGMTALVRITVSRTGQVLKIPLSALRFAPSGEVPRPVPPEAVVEGRPASIWVPGEDGTPKPVAIGVGEDDANQVAVLSGPLSEGDRVFVAELGGAPPRQLFGIRIGF
jgi:HlyD family secretion protein